MHNDRTVHATALLAIVAVVGTGWTWYYWYWIGASVPISTTGDGPLILARAKAYATRAALPFMPQSITELNAPFAATWSDVPASDFTFYPLGLLVRALGLAAGTTVAVLLAHIAAGVAFYATGIALRYKPSAAAAGAILFALAPHAFYRGLGHFTLLLYGHIPLILLTVVWLVDADKTVLRRRGGLTLGLATGLMCGALTPYYCYVFVCFVGVVAASAVAYRNGAKVASSSLFLAAAATGFALQHLDTFINWTQNGYNGQVIERSLAGVLNYSLRLPELVFPKEHAWHYPAALAHHVYYNRLPSSIIAEGVWSYMGLVPIAGLTWLLVGDTLKIPAGRIGAISHWYWLAVATLALAIVGGVTFLFAAMGFELIRVGSRFSIFLIAIALLFLCERATALLPSRRALGLIAVIVAIAISDQIPPRQDAAAVAHANARFEADHTLGSALESQLGEGAMVFQLPVTSFPEGRAPRGMESYDHLRPFLHTTSIRYSFGQTQGRPDADWQDRIADLPAREQVAALEAYGFAALVLDRRAFEDEGRMLTGNFRSLGLTVIFEGSDFVAFRLVPSETPQTPPR